MFVFHAIAIQHHSREFIFSNFFRFCVWHTHEIPPSQFRSPSVWTVSHATSPCEFMWMLPRAPCQIQCNTMQKRSWPNLNNVAQQPTATFCMPPCPDAAATPANLLHVHVSHLVRRPRTLAGTYTLREIPQLQWRQGEMKMDAGEKLMCMQVDLSRVGSKSDLKA